MTRLFLSDPLTPHGGSRGCSANFVRDEALVGIYYCYISTGGTMETAKIFWSGRSQAVRLPKDFRFDADEVRIRKHGNAVILEPMADDWRWLDAIVSALDEDFMAAINEQPGPQERAGLDKLFR